MPWSSATALGYLLKAAFGSSHTADFPGTWYMALFAGDPEVSGLEPDSTGSYARLALTNNDTNFSRSGRVVSNGVAWSFPTSTAGYQTGRQILTHWAFFDNAAAGTRWMSGNIQVNGNNSSITIDGAGLIPKIAISNWSWTAGY